MGMSKWEGRENFPTWTVLAQQPFWFHPPPHGLVLMAGIANLWVECQSLQPSHIYCAAWSITSPSRNLFFLFSNGVHWSTEIKAYLWQLGGGQNGWILNPRSHTNMDTSEISPHPVNMLRGCLVVLGFSFRFWGEKLSTGSALPWELQKAWWLSVVCCGYNLAACAFVLCVTSGPQARLVFLGVIE